MIDDEPHPHDSSPQWEEAAALYQQIFQRDNPWAADWQIEEAVKKQRDRFESGEDALKVERLIYLRTQLDQTDEHHFGEWLRAELQERKWSQSDLARAIGSYPSVVSKWIHAVQRPRSEQCARIAAALRVPLDDVLRSAGHRPDDRAHHVGDWLVESEVRNEILNIIQDIPEPLLLPLIPMLRGLSEEEVSRATLNRVKESLREQ